MRHTWVSLLLMLSISACTLGPDPSLAPQTAADDVAAFVHDQASPADEVPDLDRWWLTLADPTTAALVDEALANNTDLRVAAARVLEAEALLSGARGNRWPQADLSLNGSRGKSSFVLPTVGRVGVYSTSLSSQLSVSYQVDLFGRLARTRQAAWADALATEADRQAVIHGLVAGVVRSRVGVNVLERRLELLVATQDSWQQTLATVEDRYSFGLTPADDLHLTRQSQAAATAEVARIERQLAAARHSLDVLVGRRPGTGSRLHGELDLLPELEPVPPGLPAALLDRRPDLLAQRLRFQAATARVGVALANLYPSLNLTGGVGTASNSVSDLLSSEALVYNAVAGVLAPLFRGGQLRAEVQASKARAEQQAARYAGAVLRALAEVEDALSAEKYLHRELEARRLQLASAVAAEDLARRRYSQGTTTILQLLTTDRVRTSSEAAMLTVVNDLWTTRTALYLALGGDWLAEPTES